MFRDDYADYSQEEPNEPQYPEKLLLQRIANPEHDIPGFPTKLIDGEYQSIRRQRTTQIKRD